MFVRQNVVGQFGGLLAPRITAGETGGFCLVQFNIVLCGVELSNDALQRWYDDGCGNGDSSFERDAACFAHVNVEDVRRALARCEAVEPLMRPVDICVGISIQVGIRLMVTWRGVSAMGISHCSKVVVVVIVRDGRVIQPNSVR